MPLFEYKCAFGHIFEKYVRSGEPEQTKPCPGCPPLAPQATLQISSVSPFVWGKDGGWN
jgi:hypothetical protein